MSYKPLETRTFYDCKEYVEARDRLIPEAESVANLAVGPKPTYEGPQRWKDKQATAEWGEAFNLIFFREMDRLARGKGLVR